MNVACRMGSGLVQPGDGQKTGEFRVGQRNCAIRAACFTRRAVRTLLVATALLAPVSALAFGTINAMGQAAEHEKITRLALQPMGFQPESLDEIAGKPGTWGAVGAPDNPARNLITSDQAHCDNGDYLGISGYPNTSDAARQTLTSCKTWMLTNLDKAVTASAALLDDRGNIRDSQIPTFVSCTYLGNPGRAKCNVIEALGLAMHAGQDFYSHTNWTDKVVQGQVTIANPPGLGNTVPADWLNPASNVGFPDGLISGCFVFKPESAFCPGRVRHQDLNKDEGSIDMATGAIGRGTTPRAQGNDNFSRAVSAAIADTQNKWAYFKTRVVSTYGETRGNRIICAITNDRPLRTCP